MEVIGPQRRRRCRGRAGRAGGPARRKASGGNLADWGEELGLVGFDLKRKVNFGHFGLKVFLRSSTVPFFLLFLWFLTVSLKQIQGLV